jgi:hypothetical protein
MTQTDNTSQKGDRINVYDSMYDLLPSLTMRGESLPPICCQASSPGVCEVHVRPVKDGVIGV